MARPRHVEGQPETAERVLLAGVDAFARDGFTRTTLADVARAAGISRPSLLHHFPTKEALYAEVVTRVFSALGAALSEALGAAETWEGRLRGLCDAYTGFLAAHPTHARLVARELVDGDGPGARLLRDRAVPLLDRVTAAVALGPIRDVPVRHAILLVVSDGLLAAASRADDRAGSLGDLLWGPTDPDRTWLLARTLLLDPDRTLEAT
jgi:AcrR family transcriptional regulator